MQESEENIGTVSGVSAPLPCQDSPFVLTIQIQAGHQHVDGSSLAQYVRGQLILADVRRLIQRCLHLSINDDWQSSLSYHAERVWYHIPRRWGRPNWLP